MRNIFVTGISGFLGRIILKEIDTTHYDTIYCLCRSKKLPISNEKSTNTIKVIEGDLLDPNSYSEALAQCNTVLHLAAVTGKAKPSEYFDINTNGTKYLVRECERQGVKQFLFTSTIAVTFPDISNYYYAQSKQKAEDIVKSSQLNFSIVRPTMIIDNDGAIWNNLTILGKQFFPIILGNGKGKVQPIYGPDLAKLLLLLIDKDIFQNETYDLGGPEQITFKEFLQLIHREYRGKQHFTMHIPIGLILKILNVTEKYFSNILPINSGQLSPFRFDSIAIPNQIYEMYISQMTSPKDMVHFVVDKERTEVISKRLNKECEVFCEYLLDVKPNEYVMEKYREAHIIKKNDFLENKTTFDYFLVQFGVNNRLFTKLTDSYSRFFYRNSLFQKKIILTLGILESAYPFHNHLDAIDYENKIMFFCGMLIKSLFSLISFIFSLIIFIPCRLAFTVLSKKKSTN